MSSSFLSRRIKRTSELLKVGASDQVSEYEERFQSLRGLYDRLLSDFIVSEFSYQKAYETAREFFGSSKVKFAGVDGTMYSRPLFDLMIFFGGAYGATGTIEFRRDAKPVVEYDSRRQPTRKKVTAHSERLAEIQENSGIAIFQQNLVSTNLIHSTIKRQTHHSKQATINSHLTTSFRRLEHSFNSSELQILI